MKRGRIIEWLKAQAATRRGKALLLAFFVVGLHVFWQPKVAVFGNLSRDEVKQIAGSVRWKTWRKVQLVATHKDGVARVETGIIWWWGTGHGDVWVVKRAQSAEWHEAKCVGSWRFSHGCGTSFTIGGDLDF